MVGKNGLKVESIAIPDQDRLKSLFYLYRPLVSGQAILVYQYLLLVGDSVNNISDLLAYVGFSIEALENTLQQLNRYHLVRTYRKDDDYLLVINEPLKMPDFIKNEAYARELHLKLGKNELQKRLKGLRSSDSKLYEDISAAYDGSILKQKWNQDQENDYRKLKETKAIKVSNTLFDIEEFLAECNQFLFPISERTPQNLEIIARYGDLFNVSYEKMKTYLARSVDSDDHLNIELLKSACVGSKNEYQPTNGYEVPCINFLMNLQDGKELTPFDRKCLITLSDKYHLNSVVINVLLEHCLKECNGRLFTNYIYPIAANMHRQDVDTLAKAKQYFNNEKIAKKKISNNVIEEVPSYQEANQNSLSEEELAELRKWRGE